MRAIDAEKYMELLKEQYLHHKSMGNSQAARAWQGAMQLLYDMPTLTPPNEPLTLISMKDELPPDHERVLVYRPCMVDSDIGPYSVQWGWAAKRDGSHWAHLPDRRPPECSTDTNVGGTDKNVPTNEPLTCDGCACEEYGRDNYPCNCCSRNDETISDQYRSPEGEADE